MRAIEGGGYNPFGSSEVRKPDFRIITTTNRNLAAMVQKGRMRSDFNTAFRSPLKWRTIFMVRHFKSHRSSQLYR